MRPSLLLQQHRQEIIDIISSSGMSNIRIFGSVAKGLDHDGSDLDILVDTKDGTSLFDMIRVENKLKNVLGIEVDLLTEGDISDYFIEEVLRTSKLI